MTVYEELLSATNKKAPTKMGDVNAFLISVVDHISNTEVFSDAEWANLSLAAQSYINGCITILEKYAGKESLAKLPMPDGFVLVEEVPVPVEKKPLPAEKKSTPFPKRSRKKTKKEHHHIEFEKILETVWQNPDITKKDFMEKFSDLKPATAMLYRSILVRAVQEFKSNEMYKRGEEVS